MTGDDASSDVVTTAQALTASLNGMTAQLEELTRYGQRNRHLIWGLAVSLVLDLVLTVVIVTVAVQANHASNQAQQVHAQQAATCLSSNEARKLQVQLWEYVLSFPPTRPRTEAQEQQIKDFRSFMRKTFAQRDCSKI